MLTIDVRHNLADVERMLGDQQRQLPFAMSLALNRTAQDVKKAEQQEMRTVFDRPTRYTLNSLYIDPAKKDKLSARVWVKDTDRPEHYLLPQIFGGQRPLKRFEQMLVRRGLMRPNERAVPAAGARLDAYGNMNRGQIVQILSQLQTFYLAGSDANATNSKRSRAKRARLTYFVSTGKGTYPYGRHSWKHGRMQQELERGVWARRPHETLGSTVQPVLLFVPRATYGIRLRFNSVAERTVQRVLPGHLHAAVERALRTARPAGGAA